MHEEQKRQQAEPPSVDGAPAGQQAAPGDGEATADYVDDRLTVSSEEMEL